MRRHRPRSACTRLGDLTAPLHFPASLLLEGRSCLVFGTGPAADARARELEALFGARVVRGAAPSECAGAFLVVVERDVSEHDARAIAAGARAAHVLVHAVDRPALSDLALPAVVRRGRLSVAVSTSGASPVLAQRLRDELARILPDRLAALTERLAALRERLRALPADERAKRQRDALEALRIEGSLRLPDRPPRRRARK